MVSARALGLFFRSLVVQASWSFTGMQNAGFFLMTWPSLARRLPEGEAVAAAVRHLRHFNTHPYFAGLVAAVVVREEELDAPPDTVDGLKQALMCSLGAVGDEFFWAALRPFAAVAALPAALGGLAWAPLALLALYNVPHLSVRAWGVVAGLSRGRGIVEVLERRPLSRAVPAVGVATAFVVGVVLARLAADPDWGLLSQGRPASVAATLAAFVLLVFVQHRGLGQTRVLAALCGAAALVAAVRVGIQP